MTTKELTERLRVLCDLMAAAEASSDGRTYTAAATLVQLHVAVAIEDFRGDFAMKLIERYRKANA